MGKTQRTELVFILDKSGSMSGLERDTIGGFNSMLRQQKEQPGECVVTTALFDSNYELLHDRIDIRAVSPLTDADYRVGSCTALLDAIGMTIGKVETAQNNTAREYRADKVMFVIITDGEENASREYSARQIKKSIERLKRCCDWEFVFLGANIDAVETAGRFGIDADRAIDYVPDGAGTELNFRAVSNAVCSLRSCGEVSAECFDEIREDMRQRGGRSGRSGRGGHHRR